MKHAHLDRSSLLSLCLGLALIAGACGGEGGDTNKGSGADMAPDQAVATPDQGRLDMATSLPDQGGSVKDMGGEGEEMGPDQGGVCMDTTLYVDVDGDGYGDPQAMTMTQCVLAGQPVTGYARMAGDCQDADPLQHEMAEGVCNDYVDDDCDGSDEKCPTSMPNQMNIPAWDCTGTPPDNVYGWARFEDGKGFFKDGGCFVFFEGSKDVFYSQRVNLAPPQPCSDKNYGCICPSLNGWPSYDRRLYAFTTRGEVEACPDITLIDHGGEEQPVSNACRKYLYQLHRYDIPYSHLASSLTALEARLDTFSTVEIACAEDAPHKNLPYQTLITMQIEKNPGFVKMP